MARVFDCPNCGGSLRIEAQGATTVCTFCGNTVAIPHALQIKPPPPPPQVVYRERTVYVESNEDEARTPEQQMLGWAIAAGAILVLCCLWIGLSASDNDSGASGFSAPAETARPAVAFESQPVNDVVFGQPLRVAGRTLEVVSVAVDNRARVISFDNWEDYGDTLTVANQYFAKIVIRQAWPSALERVAAEAGSDEGSLSRTPALPLRLWLRLADGTRLASSEAYGVPEDEIGGSDARPHQLLVAGLFVIRRQRTLEDAVLEISIEGREPVQMPLTAPLPEPVFPFTYTLPVSQSWPAPGDALRYSLASVSLDVDFAFDRAPFRQRYLTVPLAVTNPSNEFSAAFEASMVRVRAGDDEYAALNETVLTIGPGETVPVRLTYLVPAGLPALDLLLGNAARQYLTAPLTLPADPLGVVARGPTPTPQALDDTPQTAATSGTPTDSAPSLTPGPDATTAATPAASPDAHVTPAATAMP